LRHQRQIGVPAQRRETEPSCLKAYDCVSAARKHLAAHFNFYNDRRPHQSHDGRTPDMVYFATLPAMKEAA
jgi:putative transposase